MPIVTRKVPAPIRKNYRSYKKFLRIDFSCKCVFCGIHENDHGGFWHFHVEHYKPKGIAKFKALKTTYGNLLYSCDHCNILKSSTWPSDDPMHDNKGWLDPCIYDLDQHYILQLVNDKLTLVTFSKVGNWMSSELHLDNSIRLEVLQKIKIRNNLDVEVINELRDRIFDLEAQYLVTPIVSIKDKIAKQQDLLTRLITEQTDKYSPRKFVRFKKR